MTADELHKIMPIANGRVEQFIAPLNEAMAEFDITTPLRQAAFIAQVGHESNQLRYVEEIASGAAYEGREDLGNIVRGDGKRFKGRGLLQITGRNNYIQCGKALALDLLLHPEFLSETQSACRSAAWFWKKHGLNELADQGNFLKITKLINGGVNGLPERIIFYEKAKAVLA